MEHYRPHSGVKFEGYYTRVLLPSGASIIFILCTIPKAPQKAYNVCLTYVSATGRIWQQEEWPEDVVFDEDVSGDGFRMMAKLAGQAKVSLTADNSQTTIVHETRDVRFVAQTSQHTPWSAHATSPESWLAYLPLPLHWHVYSLASRCKVQLSLPAAAKLDPEDADCVGVSHQEKNWAAGFPSAHIWMQARDAGRGVCLAGGRILGMQAFLVGYRNDALGLEVDFRPPFALKALGLGPFMAYDVDWENRTFTMTVQDFTRRLVIKASGPKGSFYSLSSPYPTGFKDNWIGQTMSATVNVQVWRRTWPFGYWDLVCTDMFQRAGLEFGGDFYPMRGSDKKTN